MNFASSPYSIYNPKKDCNTKDFHDIQTSGFNKTATVIKVKRA